MAPADRGVVVTAAPPKVNHLYGVKAWKSWVQQRSDHLKESEISLMFQAENVFLRSTGYVVTHLLSPVDIKEDILQCDSAELSFALTRFIKEVRRPNGETYSPDSIFYLCLGIQQVSTRFFLCHRTHRRCLVLIPSLLSRSLWTVPVHEGPHREHLYRRAVQSVCHRDLPDASTLEA